MNEHRYRWRNRQLREHVAVLDGHRTPTIVLTNATYLNVFLRKWMTGHIWIYGDRIVYVGDELPKYKETIEYVDCSDQYLVPGYIEPHAHPFQLYNPHTLAQYASQSGTTTTINDNLVLLFLLHNKKAFSLMEELNELPVSLLWWSRFDSQSMLQDEDQLLDDRKVQEWIEHDAVVQGGELTCWPSVLQDDDHVLHWMQKTKRSRKPVEGHFPGASERTLMKMKLLGTDGDHEAMRGEEVWNRLKMGYSVTLRYSSIRPDLPQLIQDMNRLNIHHYERIMLTTDGSTPAFYEHGMINRCIEICIDNGIPAMEAFCMASYNVARHYGMEHRLGSIGPGRVAHINFLSEKDNPTPISVLAKGKWVKRNGIVESIFRQVDWSSYEMGPLHLDWELTDDDWQFSTPVGLEMVNDVILKPYQVNIDVGTNDICAGNEAFLMLVDRDGQWKVTSILKGFTKTLGGLVSSYSNTMDILLIGKRKQDMKLAFKRMKEIGGGLVLANEGKIVFELPLSVAGMMTDIPMEFLIAKVKEYNEIVKAHGFTFDDPVYTLLFLSSTHLPFIRITPKGIIDVKKKDVLFPAIMR
ncbi:adenine deaminase C-terminal domain-containing protein [Pontibacillus litoralis]|uniref:adenine deaminase n=1 Tax=Pontibacillus litoralis JSM 072002 TaxID=1385512 RepID=A0A0A5G871_9BACI|nr:adenine deaminase C-terminal domain-containing protein [Pontibacillus litoralis]KGX88239.1 adenine deaminase [Pontibacillus litoralis JSM 072002]